MELKIVKIKQIEEIEKCFYKFSNDKICTIEVDKIVNFLKKRQIDYKIVPHDEITSIDKNNSQKYPKELLIVISENKKIQLISRYFSNITGKSLNIMNSSQFCKFIQDHELLQINICIITEPCFIEDIQNILFMSKVTLRCGILFGRDENELLYIINKNIVSYQESINKTVVIDRTDKKSEGIKIIDNRYFYLPYSVANKSALLSCIAKKAEVFAFAGHGRDELLWLTKGVLCGGKKSCYEKHKPSCYERDVCFKKNVEILKIKELNVINYFIYACTSGNMINPVFGFDYGLLHNFIEEMGVSYISSPYLCNECEAIIHYYAALMLSGKTLGEIIQKINIFYATYKIGNSNSFFLIGDPSLNLKSIFTEIVMKLDDMELPITQILKLERDTSILIIQKAGFLFDDFINLKIEVVVQNDSRQSLYAHIYDSKDESLSYIAVFTKGILKAGDYVVSIKKRKSAKTDTLSQLVYIYDMGLAETKQRRFFEESLKILKNFNINIYKSLCQISNIGNAVYSKYDKIVNRIKEIDYQLNNAIWKKVHISGWVLDELCLSMGFRNFSKNMIEKRCPYCEGTLFQSHICDNIYHVFRTHVFCNKCGNIEDKPSIVRLHANFKSNDVVLQKDNTNIIQLKLENLSDEAICGYISIAIVNGRKEEFNYFPKNMEIFLESKEEKEVSFSITQRPDIPSHNYWLMGILSFETELQIIKRDIFYE